MTIRKLSEIAAGFVASAMMLALPTLAGAQTTTASARRSLTIGNQAGGEGNPIPGNLSKSVSCPSKFLFCGWRSGGRLDLSTQGASLSKLGGYYPGTGEGVKFGFCLRSII